MIILTNDFTDMKIGRLRVLYQTTRRAASRQFYWLCQCDCGTLTEVIKKNLQSRRTKSCGCLQRESASKDLTGKVFGRLTAINRTDIKKSNGSYNWNCLCSCGKYKKIAIGNLISGTTRSCGCLVTETARKQMTIHGLSNTPEYKAAHSRKHKELKKILDVTWTHEMERELKALQNYCAICSITQDEHQQVYGESLHVDHVLPLSLGYGLAPGNAILLCQRHNRGKWNRRLDELPEDHATKILYAANRFKTHWGTLDES